MHVSADIQYIFMKIKEKIECTCPLCRKGVYNSADYYVDMSFLKKERPVGVSGLLRVKNDAEFLPDCIDSCIDALDELIICYQECTDNAPEIIRQKQRQYPDKIKVYFYAPPVYCHDLTDEERAYAFSLPDDSVHKLCNYYNYTLSKATYRYALKIDSDQIYFADKLKLYCDAYRKEGSVKISLSDSLIRFYVYLYHRMISKYGNFYYWDILSRIPLTRRIIIKKYTDYQIKEIVNNKYALSMSGINVGYEHGKWGIYVINKLPFNGVTDHLIFEITEDTFYITFQRWKRPIEHMPYKKTILMSGWFWYHLQAMRGGIAQYPKEWVASASKLRPVSRSAHWPERMKVNWLFFLAYRNNLPQPDKFRIGNIFSSRSV